MEAFTQLNPVLSLFLYLILTWNCTNQASMAHSTDSNALFVNGNGALAAQNNIARLSMRSALSFPSTFADFAKSSSKMPAFARNNRKLITPERNTPPFTDYSSGYAKTSLFPTPASTASLLRSIGNRDSRGGTYTNNSIINEFAEVGQAFLPARRERSGTSESEFARASSSHLSVSNSKSYSSLAGKGEANPFPVAYLMGALYGAASPAPSTLGYGRAQSSGNAAKGIPDFRGRLTRSGVAQRRSRRSSSNSNDDVSMTGGNGEHGVTETTSNHSNDYNEEIFRDGTTSSAELPQVSGDVSETAATTPNYNGSEGTNEVFSSTVAPSQAVGTIPLRGKCNETAQCLGEHMECRLNICKCEHGYLPRIDNGDLCGEASAHHIEVPTTDPTMIGVVVGLALMSVTLCIVLRLFAKARFRENRTIFNTPNPRLMNVSLLKGSKTLLRGNSAGQRSRRGSQASEGEEGESPVNQEGNSVSTNTTTAGSSSHPHPHRVKPSRTLSTDTNHESTPASSRPLSSVNRAKYRQDSVASNV